MPRDHSRPQVSVYIAMSLDGYIARQDGDLGWLDRVHVSGEDYGYADFFAQIDTVVLGRSTYDVAARFSPWPYVGKRVVVLTSRPSESRHGEAFTSASPEALVSSLGDAGARHVYVDGGQVIQAFLAAGVVDDLTISVIPILLGRGIPLFHPVGNDTSDGQGALPREQALEQRSAVRYPSGLVQLRYTIVRTT